MVVARDPTKRSNRKELIWVALNTPVSSVRVRWLIDWSFRRNRDTRIEVKLSEYEVDDQ